MKKTKTTNQELQELIGKRLKNILTFLDLSSSQASKILGIAQSTLSRYLIGHYMPSADFIVKLYEHLKVNPLYILFGLEPMFVENLSLPTGESKGNISLSPFVRTFLQKVKEMFKLNDFQLYMLSKLNLSWDDFQKMLSEDFPIEPKTLQTLSCSFCADINAIFEETIYKPNIIQTGTPAWDKRLEKVLKTCTIETGILMIDLANTNQFYTWFMHEEYGGFITKTEYSSAESPFEVVKTDLRVFIAKDFYNQIEKEHPLIVMQSQNKYFYGRLERGLEIIKEAYTNHPAQELISWIKENSLPPSNIG